MLKLAVAVFVALVALSTSELLGTVHFGRLEVGVWKAYGGVTLQNNVLTLTGNSRAYFVKPGTQQLNQNSYFEFPLSNHHVSYQIDLSRVNCGCNAAFYFNAMPGPIPTGNNDWYCDANFPESFCPEYDTLESNKHAIQTTLHKCQPNGNGWTNCDSGGCPSNTWQQFGAGGFGPGANGGIDTNQPFNISHLQKADEANIWMQQGGVQKSMEVCYGNSQYLQAMNQQWQKGMVLVATLWTADISWLDGQTGCYSYEHCDINSASYSVTNFYSDA